MAGSEKTASDNNNLLKDSRHAILTMLERLGNVVFELSPKADIIYISSAAEALYGMKPEEMIGKNISAITPLTDMSNFLKLLNDLQQGIPLSRFELKQLDKKGNIFHVEVDMVALGDVDKGVGAYGVMRDITQRKASYEQTDARKTSLHNIIESSADGIIIVDNYGKVLYANSAAEIFFDKKKDKFIGDRFDYPLGKVEETEIDIMLSDGKPGIGEMAITKTWWHKENAYLVMVRDVTQRKETELRLRGTLAQLKLTQDRLIQAERMSTVGQIASGIAHEVKNPLAIISQGLIYLEEGIAKGDKETLTIINMIKEGVERANKIILSLFDFARVENLALQPGDINAILEDSLKLVNQRLKFEQEIEIIREMGEDLPKAMVDRNRMEQVFINTFLNSIQAITGKGSITIRTYSKEFQDIRGGIGRRVESQFKPTEHAVVVEIEDTGCGIPEGNLKKIFYPFFTTKERDKGVGMGLSVCKDIVSLHRGLIDIESEVGKGTRLVFILKAVDEKVAEGDEGGKDG